MPATARGPNTLGRQAVLGLVGASPQLTLSGPNRGPGQSCGFGHEGHAAASQRVGLTGGPLTAQSLSHQRLKELVLGPHRFDGTTGLAHTTMRVQDARRTKQKRSSYFLTVPYPEDSELRYGPVRHRVM